MDEIELNQSDYEEVVFKESTINANIQQHGCSLTGLFNIEDADEINPKTQ
jgi:hypothetical protein